MVKLTDFDFSDKIDEGVFCIVSCSDPAKFTKKPSVPPVAKDFMANNDLAGLSHEQILRFFKDTFQPGLEKSFGGEVDNAWLVIDDRGVREGTAIYFEQEYHFSDDSDDGGLVYKDTFQGVRMWMEDVFDIYCARSRGNADFEDWLGSTEVPNVVHDGVFPKPWVSKDRERMSRMWLRDLHRDGHVDLPPEALL